MIVKIRNILFRIAAAVVAVSLFGCGTKGVRHEAAPSPGADGILPGVKEITVTGGYVKADRISWIFEQEDKRVCDAAYEICPSGEDGYEIYVNFGDGGSEEYSISAEDGGARITADGAAGAFYALQTLKQLIKSGGLYCCEIHDYPDMAYRGFYLDISRGKVPSIDTLKRLVDRLAELKMNSLQLYTEHTFEFEEYEFCRDRLGYITAEEMRELDRYCASKFIELVPSLATFGHLYHLLQSDRWCRLSELPDYSPTEHYWIERMKHHTVNASLDESFELVTSLIDRYSEVFGSDKFNICCDETFDLCMGVNRGKSKKELYFGFVKKLAEYVESKGKTVMMWGDIVLQYPELIRELPENIIFLNWNYSEQPDKAAFEAFRESGRRQIVCPGTNSWNAFTEDVKIEEKNISLTAQYGYENGAEGVLVTNWGDYGNICSLEAAYYGIACAAAAAWSKDTVIDGGFRERASRVIYGNADIAGLIARFSDMKPIASWEAVVRFTSDTEHGREPEKAEYTREQYQAVIDECRAIKEELSAKSFTDADIKEELLCACDGTALLVRWNAANNGIAVMCGTDYEEWAAEYSRLWLKKNKQSELCEVLRICAENEKRALAI